MNKKFIVIVIVIALALILMFSLTSCNLSKRKVVLNKLNVVVSFNAMGEFARAIGGDKVDVYTVIPNGTEPHDFEPKARDIMNISDAKVFIYNGLGLEDWIKEVNNSINSKDLIKVEASKDCKFILNKKVKDINGQYDPHIWISLKEAKTECRNIMLAFVKADSKNEAFYNENYKKFCVRADNLFNEYSKKLNSLKVKNFVTGHAAFAYLCRDFGLTQNSVEDVFAEGEPSASKLKDLVDYCRVNNIKTIFSESMVSPRISQTLATEVGARVQKIYTMESREDNRDYFSSMKEDLERIYNSLKQ